ncbi:MAG: hypothetical protein NVSMB22_21810 [Chloroflexota bacterium]
MLGEDGQATGHEPGAKGSRSYREALAQKGTSAAGSFRLFLSVVHDLILPIKVDVHPGKQTGPGRYAG